MIAKDVLNMGPDLMGRDEGDTVTLLCPSAVIVGFVRNSLDVRVAKVVPAVDETLYTQAEAAFDAVFYNTLSSSTPTLAQARDNLHELLLGPSTLDVYTDTTGIRKELSTGGTFSIETELG